MYRDRWLWAVMLPPQFDAVTRPLGFGSTCAVEAAQRRKNKQTIHSNIHCACTGGSHVKVNWRVGLLLRQPPYSSTLAAHRSKHRWPHVRVLTPAPTLHFLVYMVWAHRLAKEIYFCTPDLPAKEIKHVLCMPRWSAFCKMSGKGMCLFYCLTITSLFWVTVCCANVLCTLARQ